jgi:hypothetical protein
MAGLALLFTDQVRCQKLPTTACVHWGRSTQQRMSLQTPAAREQTGCQDGDIQSYGLLLPTWQGASPKLSEGTTLDRVPVSVKATSVTAQKMLELSCRVGFQAHRRNTRPVWSSGGTVARAYRCVYLCGSAR